MTLALKFKVQEKQQTANIARSHIAEVTGHRSVSFLNDYDEADEKE